MDRSDETTPIFTVRITDHGYNEGYGFMASSCQKSRPHLADAIADALMASDRARLFVVLADAITCLDDKGVEAESQAGATELNLALIKAARNLVDFWKNWDAGLMLPPNSPSHSAPAR